MLARLEAEDEARLHAPTVEGISPPWAEPVIRRMYRHRPLSDRPLIRLALHALYQSLEDLREGPAGLNFQDAIDWLNESDCPLEFCRVAAELELGVRASRVAIACLYPGVLVTAGPLEILRPTAPATAVLAVKAAASAAAAAAIADKPPSARSLRPADRAAAAARAVALAEAHSPEARTAAQHAAEARANANGLSWPLHAAWASVIRTKDKKARAAVKADAAEARA